MRLAERLACEILSDLCAGIWATHGLPPEEKLEVIEASIRVAIRDALNEAITAVWDSRTIEEAAAKIGAL